MTKFIHKIKCICLDILSTWAYTPWRSCTELPKLFFFTLFFHFWLHHTMYSHGGCLSTCSNMIKKVMSCAQLGCHSFLSYSYISRYTIMRNEVFVYLEIYSVYLEIYDYGVRVQGVRFPDVLEPFLSRFQMWTFHFALNATFSIGFGNGLSCTGTRIQPKHTTVT